MPDDRAAGRSLEFDDGSSLFDLMNLEEALDALLGVAVDVVSMGGLTDRDSRTWRESIPI